MLVCKTSLKRQFGIFQTWATVFGNWITPRAVYLQYHRYGQLRTKNPKPYRYPSPGAELPDEENDYTDFRLAFKDSNFNVRHAEMHNDSQNVQLELSFLPMNWTLEDYLVQVEVLKEEDKNDKKAVQKALDEYEETTGYRLDERKVTMVNGNEQEMNCMLY